MNVRVIGIAAAVLCACGLLELVIGQHTSCRENSVSDTNNTYLGLPGRGWINKSYKDFQGKRIGKEGYAPTPFMEVLIQNFQHIFVEKPRIEFYYEDPYEERPHRSIDDDIFAPDPPSNIRLQFRESFAKGTKWKDYYIEKCKQNYGLPIHYLGIAPVYYAEDDGVGNLEYKYDADQMFFRLVEVKDDGSFKPIHFKFVTPEMRKNMEIKRIKEFYTDRINIKKFDMERRYGSGGAKGLENINRLADICFYGSFDDDGNLTGKGMIHTLQSKIESMERRTLKLSDAQEKELEDHIKRELERIKNEIINEFKNNVD